MAEGRAASNRYPHGRNMDHMICAYQRLVFDEPSGYLQRPWVGIPNTDEQNRFALNSAICTSQTLVPRLRIQKAKYDRRRLRDFLDKLKTIYSVVVPLFRPLHTVRRQALEADAEHSMLPLAARGAECGVTSKYPDDARAGHALFLAAKRPCILAICPV